MFGSARPSSSWARICLSIAPCPTPAHLGCSLYANMSTAGLFYASSAIGIQLHELRNSIAPLTSNGIALSPQGSHYNNLESSPLANRLNKAFFASTDMGGTDEAWLQAVQPIDAVLLRRPIWPEVDLTGWRLLDPGGAYISPFTDVQMYTRTFRTTAFTLDARSAMYLFLPVDCAVSDPPTQQRRSSSVWQDFRRGSLRSKTAWVAAQAVVGEWYEIDLGSSMRVDAVVLRGRGDAPQWVTAYKVQVLRLRVVCDGMSAS